MALRSGNEIKLDEILAEVPRVRIFLQPIAPFIAGFYGFPARDCLVTVINTMWGSFWIAQGIAYYLIAANIVPSHSIYTHWPELAAWFVPLAVFTWAGAIASFARDLFIALTLTFLATGSTLACCLFSYGEPGIRHGMKAAAYFWIFSSITAAWRVFVYLQEEAWGARNPVVKKAFPVFRFGTERRAPLVVSGLGEPGVKRGMPGVI